MSKRAVLLTLSLLLSATLATLAAPQEDEESSGPLPFLQFTKGGIRVNFGGYHAQAGLGGLLTGKRADGGLHVSAGTPTGAHASAGLGGSLTDGPFGGLHARAGLGNGGPEAEAGLGGTLAGPRPRGEIYANSSPGAGFVLKSDQNNVIDISDPNKSKNIQEVVGSVDAASDASDAMNKFQQQLQLERRQRRQEKRARLMRIQGYNRPEYLYDPLPRLMIADPLRQQPFL